MSVRHIGNPLHWALAATRHRSLVAQVRGVQSLPRKLFTSLYFLTEKGMLAFNNAGHRWLWPDLARGTFNK